MFGTFISSHKIFTSPPRTAARLAAPTDRPWATGIKETLARHTHSITVSVPGTRLRYSSFARKS